MQHSIAPFISAFRVRALSGIVSRVLGIFLIAGVLPSLRAEEPAAPAADAPLRAVDLECWEKGVQLVIGGWENTGYGVEWMVFLIEVTGEEEVDGKKATVYRHRTLAGLEMADYLRLRNMKDERFLKEFARRHASDEGAEYRFWQREEEGAVIYWDDDGDDGTFQKPGVMIPADLSIGAKFESFGGKSEVVARDEAFKGPWGECLAVRMDSHHPEEVVEEDGEEEEYPAYRVETWLGRGLSTVWSRSWEVVEVDEEDEDTEQEAETLVSETRLLRVIRPAAVPAGE